MRYILWLLLGLLAACSDPAARFDEFAIHHPINLARHLGSAPALVGKHDTLTLHVRFDPTSGHSLITAEPLGDTLLFAPVWRYKQLYYVMERLRTTGCWVYGMQIKRGQVRGLNTGYKQMIDLTQLVKQEHFNDLVRYQNVAGDSIRLRFDKAVLHSFYVAELDSVPVYRILSVRDQPAVAASAIQPALFPNPASTTTTLTLQEGSVYTVFLYDSNGEQLNTWRTSASQLSLSVRELKAGTYLVRSVSGDNRRQAYTSRLVVEH
ncbi:hypothetical protein GCM10027346_22210 [Hymenobacter seoulensis]